MSIFKKWKNSIILSSASFQTFLLVIVFLLGVFGEKVVFKTFLLISRSWTPIGMDWDKGWYYLRYIEGVWEVVLVVEIIIFLGILFFVWWLLHIARENEEKKEKERDDKLASLPHEIATAIAKPISEAVSEAIKASFSEISKGISEGITRGIIEGLKETKNKENVQKPDAKE